MRWVQLPKSTYNYKPSSKKRGIPPSSVTRKKDGSQVNNTVVVDEIKTILCQEFVCYGYQNVTVVLRNQGYVINPKKVYRLMDESHLLLGKVIKTQGKREWVKYRKIQAQRPMEYLCWDIKYLWVQAKGAIIICFH